MYNKMYMCFTSLSITIFQLNCNRQFHYISGGNLEYIPGANGGFYVKVTSGSKATPGWG